MSKTILDMSSVSSSISSDETESTNTQLGNLATPSPPIQNSTTFNNLAKPLTTTAANLPQSHQTNANPNTHTPFRKCRSFIHLTKPSDRVQSSLIDSGNCDRLRKSASTPNAIYMAIKQEHRFLVHRIFNRCKVILIFRFA